MRGIDSTKEPRNYLSANQGSLGAEERFVTVPMVQLDELSGQEFTFTVNYKVSAKVPKTLMGTGTMYRAKVDILTSRNRVRIILVVGYIMRGIDSTVVGRSRHR